MKQTSRILTTTALAVACFTYISRADDQQRTTPADSPGTTHPTVREQTQIQHATDAPTRMNKVSSLLNMSIQSPDEKKLGKIDDIVFDLNNAKVSYVVLGRGGVLGIGEKQVAVPLMAFTPAPDQNAVVLNTTKEQLQMAQGLKKGNWPSVTSPAWGAQPFWVQPGSSVNAPPNGETANKYANENSQAGTESSVNRSTENNRAATENSLNRSTTESSRAMTANVGQEPPKINRASGLLDMQVRDPQGNKISTLKDIVVDLKTGKAAYAVITRDTSEGANETGIFVPVPLNAFMPSPDNSYLVLNTTKEKLSTAQGFTQDNWPSVSNPSFGNEHFWEMPAHHSQRQAHNQRLSSL